MDNKKRLAYAIIRFLHDQLRHGGLSSDAQESLEVAIQCLETAFGVTVEDHDLALPQTLPEIFEAAAMGKEMPQHGDPERTPPSEEDSAEAERLKTEGNEQMKVENFEAAVHFYGKAIELNPANAVYFCNRAAAYSKLGNYAGAVQDCERAICIDPAYSKAYGRMGLALSSLSKHTEAVVYYKKALELDPDNETYKSNLRIAELKLREAPSPTGGAGSFDIAGLLNNPGFMSMVLQHVWDDFWWPQPAGDSWQQPLAERPGQSHPGGPAVRSADAAAEPRADRAASKSDPQSDAQCQQRRPAGVTAHPSQWPRALPSQPRPPCVLPFVPVGQPEREKEKESDLHVQTDFYDFYFIPRPPLLYALTAPRSSQNRASKL
uniref:Small glutamine-rich tetratricopeptide repeat-containing protein alpha n=1 Tax=Rousettus aegyptiacus TaxID=9407 RepID=A0A7J8BV84_ROUAE|nr:small glutamine rich tetratricopeptide repeat containing alpha [Rousettus aegyptiacus]